MEAKLAWISAVILSSVLQQLAGLSDHKSQHFMSPFIWEPVWTLPCCNQHPGSPVGSSELSYLLTVFSYTFPAVVHCIPQAEQQNIAKAGHECSFACASKQSTTVVFCLPPHSAASELVQGQTWPKNPVLNLFFARGCKNCPWKLTQVKAGHLTQVKCISDIASSC